MRVFSMRTDGPESGRLDLPDAGVEAISASGELLIMLGRQLGNFWETGTLARVPLVGGAPRSLADNVLAADWGPDGAVALVRQVGERFRLEYPSGHLLYEASTWLNSPRVSPRGDRIAFLAEEGGHFSVNVVDRSGAKRVLSSGWKWGGRYVLWVPGGEELWFSASDGGWNYQLRAVSLSGRQRVLLRLPGSIFPQDLSPDGRRLLMGVGSLRSVTKCLPQHETRERDLSWLAATALADLSPDGTLALISEIGGSRSAREDATYLRKTDGSPPVRLAEAGPVGAERQSRMHCSQPVCHEKSAAAHLDVEYPALLSFLWDPRVDATNWRAEHAIRPAVVNRNVCGRNRTPRGAPTQQILASVVRTIRQRRLDLDVFSTRLRAPQLIVEAAFQSQTL